MRRVKKDCQAKVNGFQWRNLIIVQQHEIAGLWHILHMSAIA